MKLTTGAWAVLALLQRLQHDGERAPEGYPFVYGELERHGLISRVDDKVTVTLAGEAALFERAERRKASATKESLWPNRT